MSLIASMKRDIRAALERDPAASSGLVVFFTYPGFHARQYHRVAHRLHRWGFRGPARPVPHRHRDTSRSQDWRGVLH
jgi:serine O-acetyltransferase